MLITFLQKLQIHVRMNTRVGTITRELKIHACVKQCVLNMEVRHAQKSHSVRDSETVRDHRLIQIPSHQGHKINTLFLSSEFIIYILTNMNLSVLFTVVQMLDNEQDGAGVYGKPSSSASVPLLSTFPFY